MADIYDVQYALSQLSASAVYPNGMDAPSVVNYDVRIYPGWPNPNTLDADLLNMVSHVSVFATNMSLSSTRFDTRWLESSINPVTLFFTVTNTTILIEGIVTLPQTILLRINGYDYVYTVQASDTLDSIALNISLLVPGAYSNGNRVIFVIVRQIEVNVSTRGMASREYAREARIIYVSIWAPTPEMCAMLDAALQVVLGEKKRLLLPDHYYANISLKGARKFDTLEKVNCYRNDLFIQIDYAITETNTYYSIAQNIVNVNSEAITPAILFQLLSGGNFLLLNTQNLALLE